MSQNLEEVSEAIPVYEPAVGTRQEACPALLHNFIMYYHLLKAKTAKCQVFHKSLPDKRPLKFFYKSLPNVLENNCQMYLPLTNYSCSFYN